MKKINTYINSTDTFKLWTPKFIIITVINSFSFLCSNMATIGIPTYAATLSDNNIALGLITTFSAIAALLSRPFAGFFLDRINRVAILSLGFSLMVTASLGYMVYPFISGILIMRLLHGIGWGLCSSATATLASDFLPKSKIAEGLGYMGAISSIFSSIAPTISMIIFTRLSATFMLLIILSSAIAGLILSLLLIYKQLPTNNTNNTLETTHHHKTSFIEPKALLPAMAIASVTIAYSPIATFITPYITEKGFKTPEIFFYSYAFSTIIARPLTGKIADKKGYYKIAVLSLFSMGISSYIFSIINSLTFLCLGGLLSGFAMGGGMSSLQAMAVANVSPEKRGTANSTFLYGFDAGMALGSFAAGYFRRSTEFGIIFSLMSIIPIVSCILISIIHQISVEE